MSSQRMVRLPSKVIYTVLKTEAEMDKFLAKQAREWELETLA